MRLFITMTVDDVESHKRDVLELHGRNAKYLPELNEHRYARFPRKHGRTTVTARTDYLTRNGSKLTVI